MGKAGFLQSFKNISARTFDVMSSDDYTTTNKESLKNFTFNQNISMNCIGAQYKDPYVMTPAYKLSNMKPKGIYDGGEAAKNILKLSTVDLLNPSSINNLGRRTYRWIKEDKFIVYQDLVQKIAGIVTLIWGVVTLILIMLEFKSGCNLTYDATIADSSTNPDMAKTQITKINNILTSGWYKPLKTTCLTFIYLGTIIQLFKRTTSVENFET